MKNTILRLSFFVFTALLLTGCLGTKKTTSSTTKEIEKTTKEVSKDSVAKTIINAAIKDELTAGVSQSDTGNKSLDSIVNSKVDEILNKLNTTKKSGGNSYKLYYDDVLRAVKAEFELAATKNEETKVKNQETTDTEKSLTIEEKTKKIIRTLPWWVWVALVVYLLPKILNIVSVFTPMGAVGSLFKKRN